ncbi:unnamed protein product [Ostreobium quekettii]|uniref:Uncharacterized protein n=1 Tax=Ostreobium quekettii TaxID=121088 RepID=A0A8S1IPF3_9CHLO|nr:unnamed protein product [Ostreobium quekettii]|eukprot:evm.model.scf_65.7 EVM.evm.TU.scf_65.7   scf_65:51125-61476(+)
MELSPSAPSLDGLADELTPLGTELSSVSMGSGQGTASVSEEQGPDERQSPKAATKRRRIDRPPKRGLPLSNVVNTVGFGLGAAACWGGWKGGLMKVGGGFVWGIALGCAAGLELTKRYKKNRQVKFCKLDFLGRPLTGRGIFHVLNPNDPFIPNLTSSERVESINRALRLMWPFYEPCIVKLILETVTPLLDAWKPSFIKQINFQKLTFGDVPFSMTGVEVLKHGKDEFVFQAAIRWHGRANISLKVEAGGVTMQPRVERLDFFANVRVALTPLVDNFPCFGAMTLAFLKPPMVKFEISVGTPLMEFNSDTVKDFLENFVVHHIFGDLLVWPNRIVVPILPESQRGNIDHLYLHTRGVIRVVVKEADGMGAYGEGVAWKVFLQTVSSTSHSTEAKSGDRIVWGEEHYLKVQELSQSLRATVVDESYGYMDPLMASTTKQVTQRGRKVGSCFVEIRDLEAGVAMDNWYELGSTACTWGSESGMVTPRDMVSRLHLELTYMPLDWLRRGRFCATQQCVHHGLLFFRLLRGFNLPTSLQQPYCELKLVNTVTGKERGTKKSRCMKQVNNFYIEWNESFEWFNVSVDEVMSIKVFDIGKYKVRQVGCSEIRMSDVAAARDPTHTEMLIETLTLEEGKGRGRGGGKGDLEVELDWVPLDHNPTKASCYSSNSGRSARSRELGHTPLKRVTLPRGCLHVRLLWAHNLQNVDWIGKSDPYVVMRVNANQRQSSVIYNDLNPVWKEEFKWRSVKGTDVLALDILDRGTISDTVIARCDIQISVAANHPGEVKKLTEILLSSDMTKQAGGTITVQMHFQPVSSSGDLTDRSGPAWPELAPDEW